MTVCAMTECTWDTPEAGDVALVGSQLQHPLILPFLLLSLSCFWPLLFLICTH